MKTGTISLASALALTGCAAVWLLLENTRLRDTLAAAAIPSKRSPARPASASPAPPPIKHTPERNSAGTAATTTTSSAAEDSLLPPSTSSPRLTVTDNANGTFTVSDPLGGWQKTMKKAELDELRQNLDATLMASTTKLPGGPSWSPGRAAGAPDTPGHGDYVTAWASQAADGGTEWLQLKYSKAVEIGEINIHETYNSGAISKVTALMPNGRERIIWEGTMNPEEGVVERAVKVPPGITSDQIRIELDTSRVPGWNEIDAVELIGTDGSRQWAAESTASSYYGHGRGIVVFSDDLGIESLPSR